MYGEVVPPTAASFPAQHVTAWAAHFLHRWPVGKGKGKREREEKMKSEKEEKGGIPIISKKDLYLRPHVLWRMFLTPFLI